MLGTAVAVHLDSYRVAKHLGCIVNASFCLCFLSECFFAVGFCENLPRNYLNSLTLVFFLFVTTIHFDTLSKGRASRKGKVENRSLFTQGFTPFSAF